MNKFIGGMPTRRSVLKGAVATGAVLAAPNLNRAWAADPVEITMLAWYGHGEPDMVEEFEALHNVQPPAKYYHRRDNLLVPLAHPPHGTHPAWRADVYSCPHAASMPATRNSEPGIMTECTTVNHRGPCLIAAHHDFRPRRLRRHVAFDTRAETSASEEEV